MCVFYISYVEINARDHFFFFLWDSFTAVRLAEDTRHRMS